MGVCFLTPKARTLATAAAGFGSIASEPIGAGEVVAAFGGRCVTRDEFDLLPASQQVRSLQIDEELFLAGAPEPEPADFINHSCDPNCLLSGSVILVAARDIEAGEEITYDYATSDGTQRTGRQHPRRRRAATRCRRTGADNRCRRHRQRV